MHVAYIAVSTNESVIAQQSFLVEESPEWPSDFNDGKRFYLVRHSIISFVLFMIDYKQD